MSDNDRSRWTQKPWILLAFIVSIASVEIVALIAQEATVPETEDWRAAAQYLTENVQDRDGLRIAPSWIDPMVRYHLSEPLARRLVRQNDIEGLAAVWEVSIRGERHPDLHSLEPTSGKTFGRVTVQKYEKEAAAVVYDFTSGFSEAVVEREPDNSCEKRGDQWMCGKSWKNVRRRYLEVDFQPHWCVFAHPEKNKTLRILYPTVPDGKRLVLYTGIGDVYARKKGSGPVKIGIYSGDQPLGEVNHEEKHGWKRTVVPFRRGDASIRFEITAPKPQQRQFCFHAELHQ